MRHGTAWHGMARAAGIGQEECWCWHSWNGEIGDEKLEDVPSGWPGEIGLVFRV